MKRYLIVAVLAFIVVPVTTRAQSADIQAQISALTQLIAQLQGQGSVAPAATTVSHAPAEAAACLNYPVNIKAGYFDLDAPGPISQLQTYLASTGDFLREPTGYFGPATTAAVQKWQKRNGIAAGGTPQTTGYGMLGPKTRAALRDATCSEDQLAAGVSVVPATISNMPQQQPVTSFTPVPQYTQVNASCRLGSVYVPSGSSIRAFARTTVSRGSTCEEYMTTRTCENGTLIGNNAYSFPSCTVSDIGSCVIGGLTLAHGESRTFYNMGTVPLTDSCANHTQQRTCQNGVLTGQIAYAYSGCGVATPRTCTLDSATVAHGASQFFYSQKTVPFGSLCTSYSQSRACNDGTLSGSGTYQYASCAVAASSTCAVGNVTLADGTSRQFYSKESVDAGVSCATVAQSRSCSHGVLSGDSSYTYPSCTDTVTSCSLDGQTIANGATTTGYLVQYVGPSDSCSFYSQVRGCSNAVLAGDAVYKYRSCSPVESGKCVVDNVILNDGESRTFYSTSTAATGYLCTSYKATLTCSNGSVPSSSYYNRANCTNTASCTLDGATVAHGESRNFYSAATVAYGSSCSAISQSRTCTNGSLSGSYAYATCSVSPPVSLVPVASQLAAIAETLTAILASLAGGR